jgi:hypothetical protein
MGLVDMRERKDLHMTKANAIRVLRPQGLAVVLGMGAFSVAAVGLTIGWLGGDILPPVAQIAVALIGILGGAKAVLASD